MLRCPEQANPEKQQRNKKCRETDAGGRVDDRRRCFGRTRADGVMPLAYPTTRRAPLYRHADDNSHVACMETATLSLALTPHSRRVKDSHRVHERIIKIKDAV